MSEFHRKGTSKHLARLRERLGLPGGQRPVDEYTVGRVVVMSLDQGKSRPWVILRSTPSEDGGRILFLNGLTSKPTYGGLAHGDLRVHRQDGRPDSFLSGMFRIIHIGGQLHGRPHLDAFPMDQEFIDLAIQRVLNMIGEYNHG